MRKAQSYCRKAGRAFRGDAERVLDGGEQHDANIVDHCPPSNAAVISRAAPMQQERQQGVSIKARA
jgi:hypothetical protein